jgi:hypothetical protein
LPLVFCDRRHPPRQRELSAGELAVRIATNGSRGVLAWCDECSRWSSDAIATAYVCGRGIDLSALPVATDHRGLLAICSVKGCGSDDVELDHFAPRGIFGEEADEWPTAFLCRKHHAEWGQRVTPSLNPPPKLRSSGV